LGKLRITDTISGGASFSKPAFAWTHIKLRRWRLQVRSAEIHNSVIALQYLGLRYKYEDKPVKGNILR